MKWRQLGIIGKSGTGKSYLTNKIIDSLESKRIICIDDHRQFRTLRNNDQFFRVSNIDDFVAAMIEKDSFKIICSFEDFSDYSYLFGLIWKLNNLTIIVDEISIYADSFNIDEYLKEIILRGRLKNISVVWNTQRPALINRTVFSQLTDLISFQIFDVRDIVYLPSKWKKSESTLSVLKQGEYKVIIDSGNLELFLKTEKKA